MKHSMHLLGLLAATIIVSLGIKAADPRSDQSDAPSTVREEPINRAVLFREQFPAIGRAVPSAPKDNLSSELDAFPGSSWGPGGPWADQIPYTPRRKPAGWVDPETSRWPWTGECDPYACPYRSQDDVSPPGHDTQTAAGTMPKYRGSPPP
jgi:hypothetical protein